MSFTAEFQPNLTWHRCIIFIKVKRKFTLSYHLRISPTARNKTILWRVIIFYAFINHSPRPVAILWQTKKCHIIIKKAGCDYFFQKVQELNFYNTTFIIILNILTTKQFQSSIHILGFEAPHCYIVFLCIACLRRTHVYNHDDNQWQERIRSFIIHESGKEVSDRRPRDNIQLTSSMASCCCSDCYLVSSSYCNV